jgi:hypothetical protein
MGKTVKRMPRGRREYFRHPRGHKQALVEGARKGTVPPSSYDDIPYDRQVWQPQQAAREMVKQGMTNEEIIRRLRLKWRLTQARAVEMLGWLR